MGHKSFHQIVESAADLVTTSEKTVAGFVVQAKEKTVRAAEIVQEAIRVKERLEQCESIEDVIADAQLKAAVLFCAGLSAKAQKHLTNQQLKDIARATLEEIRDLGNDMGNEVLFRYLLTAGDSLGGTMRNWTGASAPHQVEQKVQEALTGAGIEFELITSNTGKVQVIYWDMRVLVFDKTPKFIGKNIDVILLRGDITSFQNRTLLESKQSYLAAGELKGGIDPAGADEHWKTASKALQRIRDSFAGHECPKLFFAGAAIATAMASEIYDEVSAGSLEFAANLTSDEQISALIEWLIAL